MSAGNILDMMMELGQFAEQSSRPRPTEFRSDTYTFERLKLTFKPWAQPPTRNIAWAPQKELFGIPFNVDEEIPESRIRVIDQYGCVLKTIVVNWHDLESLDEAWTRGVLS